MGLNHCIVPSQERSKRKSFIVSNSKSGLVIEYTRLSLNSVPSLGEVNLLYLQIESAAFYPLCTKCF